MGLKKMGLILGFIGFLFLNGLVELSMAANIHHYSFILKETSFTRLCTTKNMLTVNGMFPGPTITVRRGDTAFINVHNDGKYGVTIHWHGVKQPRNPWSDGPENITQCPIQPGKNFTYEVNFSTEEGTLWWHAHSDWSRATIHGPIVILPPIENNYPFQTPYQDKTILLASWFNEDPKQIYDNATATGAEPDLADAYTINGWQGVSYSCSNETTAYLLQVDYGNTYLLRVINAVMNTEMFFGIAQHNFTVVAQDAAYIKPITTNYIMISPGQTMDILFTANQNPSYYFMAARPFADTTAPSNDNATTAIVQYSGSYTPPLTPPFPDLPGITDKQAADSFTNQIRSLANSEYPVNVPTKIDKSIFMAIAVNQIVCPDGSCGGPDGNRLAASLNNITFSTPTLDILTAYYWNINNGTYTPDFPNRPPHIYNFTGDVGNSTIYNPVVGTYVTKVKYGDAVEIVFQGTNVGSAENHPMHLHGFSFYLVGTGYGNFDPKTSPQSYNLVDPPLVNTIGVPKDGWATIRFFANNPGVWFMHCHFEKHASWGMANAIIVENGPTEETSIRRPPSNLPSCSLP